MNKEDSKKTQGSTRNLIILLLVLITIFAGIICAIKLKKAKQVSNKQEEVSEKIQEVEEIPEPKTFAGNERAIAFMIDNNIDAMPQAGLAEADLVYEIIVEGGETRLMAVMKDKNLDRIGPLRSARHYFIDYALENDAIYVHYGQSPQAASDIKTLGIDDINGIYESSTNFWRDSSRYAPHNAVSSSANIKKIIDREEFRTTSKSGTVLNYVTEEVELPEIKEKTLEDESEEKVTNLASTVIIPYSYYNTVKYTYNEEKKEYTRYSRDKKQLDWNTEKTINVKNIIITKCKNSTLDDGTNKGRQTLDNIKILDGYYITNGKYIPIKCEKTSRSGKTIYKDLKGNEINVNDGKTFIQICPIDSDISFE